MLKVTEMQKIKSYLTLWANISITFSRQFVKSSTSQIKVSAVAAVITPSASQAVTEF